MNAPCCSVCIYFCLTLSSVDGIFNIILGSPIDHICNVAHPAKGSIDQPISLSAFFLKPQLISFDCDPKYSTTVWHASRQPSVEVHVLASPRFTEFRAETRVDGPPLRPVVSWTATKNREILNVVVPRSCSGCSGPLELYSTAVVPSWAPPTFSVLLSDLCVNCYQGLQDSVEAIGGPVCRCFSRVHLSSA